MNSVKIRVAPAFRTKLKKRAAEKGISIIKLTENLAKKNNIEINGKELFKGLI